MYSKQRHRLILESRVSDTDIDVVVVVVAASSACSWVFFFFCGSPGAAQGGGPDAVPGQEEVLRRVQVSQVQEEVDERELLGQHGAGVHQVPHQRLPSQAGDRGPQYPDSDINKRCCYHGFFFSCPLGYSVCYRVAQ